MSNLSLVTAKITRENEQYNYRLVGKGEKYLVRHEDGENAGDKVVEELTPFAKDPIVVQQVILQKFEGIVGKEDAELIFNAKVEWAEENERTHKIKKVTKSYFVRANSTREAFDELSQYLEDYLSDDAITSVVKTKIIDII